MKRILVSMAGVMIGVFSVLGQGTVNFSNFGGNPIKYDVSVPGKNGANVEVNAFSAALYWAPLGSTEAQLTQIGAIGNINPLAGFFLLGTRTTGSATAAGSPGMFQVRAWSAGFTSYEAAAAAAASDPTKYIGKSILFQNNTGGGGTPPGAPAALLMPGFNVASVAVPEPSVIILGVLGAGALLLRRRK